MEADAIPEVDPLFELGRIVLARGYERGDEVAARLAAMSVSNCALLAGRDLGIEPMGTLA